MSNYATRLLLDGDPNSEDGALGPPIIYEGSHVIPSADDARCGWVEIAGIPAFCGPNPAQLVDFLRLDVSEDNGCQATVVLDRAQVERIRDTLTDWLNREVERG